MSNENFKVINFDPHLNFEDSDYNVEKVKNSIIPHLDFDLDNFESDINQKKEEEITELDNLEMDEKISKNYKILKYQEETEKVEEPLQEGGKKDEIDFFLENINEIFSKKNIKSKVNELITNYNSNKFNDYLEQLNHIYAKNLKKYKIERKNKTINLIDKKQKKIIKKINILDIKFIETELIKLKKEVEYYKYVLINLYINIHYGDNNKKKELENNFNNQRKKYVKLNELYISYDIYNKLINEDLKENFTLLALPTIKIDKDTLNKYIENKNYQIPNDIIEEIYNNNMKANKLYNNLMSSEKKERNKIEEYLKVKINEKNDINKKINKLIIKENNRIKIII
jgi:hypothetical protein